MGEQHYNGDVLVVGAGIAGLMAASRLEQAGLRVLVVEKGEAVGGRLATYKIGGGFADYGAQFFTVRDDTFKKIVDEWIKEDLVFEWSKGFSDGSLDIGPADDGHERYAIKGGFNALPQRIAHDLQHVFLSTTIATATCDESGWILQDQDANLFTGRALLMTPPVPQALQILDEGATILDRKDFDALNRIDYAPCLTGIFEVEGRATLPRPGAIQRRNANITWISDNHQKGISPNATILTVQASEQYSAQMWSAPDERIIHALETDLKLFLAPDTTIKSSELKRWRYSIPLVIHEDHYYLTDNDPLLVFAGDAFGGPRVEGATLSGLAAGEVIVKQLQGAI
jgi:predicted NAD/FAD-dependent oxidoreductase